MHSSKKSNILSNNVVVMSCLWILMGMFMVVVVRMLQYLETFLKVMLLFQKRGNMENVIKTNQKIKINLIFILKRIQYIKRWFLLSYIKLY
jgi:hypothetical protein